MTNIDNTAPFSFKNNVNITPHKCVFWTDDVTILYRDKGYIQFIPTPDMSSVEQFNALTRFCLYLIILLLIFDRSDLLYLPLIGLIIVIILYNVSEVGTSDGRDELLKISENIKDVNDDSNYKTYQIDDDGDVVTIDKNHNHPSWIKNYDSDNTYLIDDIQLYKNVECRKSTVDNSFMNLSITDFNTENVPVACNANDEDIKKDMELKFNEDMYRDIEDVFDKKNSQRQFYTVAHNIPNDMEGFARWCYKFPPTCKTNQERCLRYDDLRF